MGVFIAAAGSAAILVGVLLLANKRKERQRVALGKPAKVHDRSMAERYVAGSGEENEADLRASELSDFKVRFTLFSFFDSSLSLSLLHS